MLLRNACVLYWQRCQTDAPQQTGGHRHNESWHLTGHSQRYFISVESSSRERPGVAKVLFATDREKQLLYGKWNRDSGTVVRIYKKGVAYIVPKKDTMVEDDKP